MKVKIEIDCSDIDEIYSHLAVIKSQIKQHLKTVDTEKKIKTFTVEDSNCYGSHKAKVIDDVGPYKATLITVDSND